MDFPDHPFWDFSLAVYGAEGVPAACLALQERHGLDVNMLLFCCWLGQAGFGDQGAGRLARLQDAVALWHGEVVRPLRAVRRRLKERLGPLPEDLSQALRARIAKIEIDAEHIEQLGLAAALGDAQPEPVGPAEGARAAAANLAGYFALLGLTPDDADRDALAAVLAAAFPALEPAETRQICEKIVG